MYFSYWVAYIVYRRKKKGLARMLNRMAWINVALGLATVLIALFVLRGFRHEVSEKLHSLMGHIQVHPYVLPSNTQPATMHIHQSHIYQSYHNAQLPAIRFLQPYAQQAALLKTQDRAMGVQFKGIQTAYQAIGGLPGLKEGRMIQFHAKKYSKECVISTNVAHELAVSVGDTLLVHFLKEPPQYRKLRIVGLYKTALEELDTRLMIGDVRLLQRLHAWPPSQIEGLEVFLHPNHAIDAQVTALFNHAAYGVEVRATTQNYPQFFDWFTLLDTNTYAFLGLIAGVAGFNMLALCMILMMERRAMIGVLQVLGASTPWVQRVFFAHGLLWVFWGMFLGNVLALGVSFLQKEYHVLTLDPKNYAMDHVPIHMEWTLWLGVNAGFFLWLCVALMLPLRRITRRHPLPALRFR